MTERRAVIVDALNKAIEIFTSYDQKDFSQIISNGIRPVAEAVGLDRVVFYRRIDLDGNIRLGQVYRWDKSGGGLISLDDDLKALPDIPLFARWIAITSKGGSIRIRESKMAEDERVFFKTFGIKSDLILPIFTQGDFWGVVSFQDHTTDRYFDEDCADLLYSAARLFAGAIIRADVTQTAEKSMEALKRREKMVTTLNKAAVLFLSQTESTFESMMTTGIKLIADEIDLDRLSIWRNFEAGGSLHTSQIYRWDRESGGTTVPTPGLEDVTYTRLAPRWEKLLAEDEIVNSPVHLLPESAMLKNFGVVSALVIPIFFNNAFWGFMLCEDRVDERYFDGESIEMMRSATLLCVNTVIGAEMERKVAEANQRTKLMLDTIPISCQWWDKNLNVIDCNSAAVKLFGLGSKEEFFERFFTLMPEYQPDGQRSDEKAVSIVKKAFEDGSYGIEWMHKMADGTLMPAEVNLERIKYKDEDPILVGYVRDLRKQKQLISDIEQANEFNQATLDAAPFGINMVDENIKLFDCNDAVLKLLGYEKQYYLDHFLELAPEYQEDGQKSGEKAVSVVKRALEGENVVIEWQHFSKSGELIPFEVTLTRVKFKGKFIVLSYQYDLSNIKKVEQQARNANELNRVMVEAAPMGITVFDENKIFYDCNDTIVNAYGGTKEQFINNFLNFSPEFQEDGSNSAERIDDIVEKTLAGERLVYEWMHRSLSGELIPFEVTTTRVKHYDKYIGIAFQYNLSNIKKMEKEIEEAKEMTRAIIEASPVAYVLFDDNFEMIDCNDEMLRMLACPDKQYLKEHYWDVFVPELQADGKDSYEETIALRKKVSLNEKSTFEWLHRSLSGEIIPVDNTLTQIMYKGRKVFITFKYDLRNIKKMTESIREQGELLKIRLEQQELISEISRGFIASGDSQGYVTEAIAKLGLYHKVSRVNIFSIDYRKRETCLEHFWTDDGQPPRRPKFNSAGMVLSTFSERLPDSSTKLIISCDDVAAVDDDFSRALLSVGVNAYICTPLYVDGLLWGILNVEQCFKPRSWTGNEKEFTAMTASTIAGVIMRDIYNSRLKDALDKATAASRAKGEFLSNMSHEMRTPLNAIIGMTNIGKNAADMERKDYALQKIDDASAHLLGVINDVLDMSKIEANMLELSPEEFHFEKMLQRVVNVVNFRIEEKHQKFSVHIDKAIPETLIGDDQRLAQIITNLLGNAVKFTPEKGSLNLDALLLKEENGFFTIQIAVSDTGIGISADQQERIFSSFEQAESSTTRKFGGTGLGLPISRSIVELMGGKIWIESEVDKGSTFFFTAVMKGGESKKQSGLLDSKINLGNVRVMVVDDDQDILDYLKDIVQRIGASCDTALSGKDALRLVEKNGAYNIYFIDWKMPIMDGITLTAMIKKTNFVPGNTVVIMISAAEWNAVETEAKKAGVDKFLSKPLFSSTIVDVIGECLGENQKPDAEKPPDIEGCFAGKRILLAEDVEINREIVMSLLEPTLIEVHCAENGVEAVRMFSEAPQKYDLIFMDVQMPEMDGYEATKRIRELSAANAKTVPIVAMTANVFREDIDTCLAAGMNDHIGKPLDFEEVIEKLRFHLLKRR